MVHKGRTMFFNQSLNGGSPTYHGGGIPEGSPEAKDAIARVRERLSKKEKVGPMTIKSEAVSAICSNCGDEYMTYDPRAIFCRECDRNM